MSMLERGIVERVALAIYTDLNAQEDMGSTVQDCNQAARAAIEAVRDHLNAVRRKRGYDGKPLITYLDAALNDAPSTVGTSAEARSD